MASASGIRASHIQKEGFFPTVAMKSCYKAEKEIPSLYSHINVPLCTTVSSWMVSRWNKAGPLLHANLNTVVQGTLEKRENKKLVTVDIFTNGKSVRLALLVFQASNSERKKKNMPGEGMTYEWSTSEEQTKSKDENK